MRRHPILGRLFDTGRFPTGFTTVELAVPVIPLFLTEALVAFGAIVRSIFPASANFFTFWLLILLWFWRCLFWCFCHFPIYSFLNLIIEISTQPRWKILRVSHLFESPYDKEWQSAVDFGIEPWLSLWPPEGFLSLALILHRTLFCHNQFEQPLGRLFAERGLNLLNPLID